MNAADSALKSQALNVLCPVPVASRSRTGTVVTI